MLKRMIAVVSFLSVMQVQAADSVVLKVKQLENRAYRTVTTTVVGNEFNLKAPKEILDQFAAAGVKLPLKVSQTQKMVNVVKTGGTKGDGSIPFSGALDTSAHVVSNSKNAEQNTQKHFEVTGAYRENGMTIESVKGDGVTPKIEAAVKQTLAKAMETNTFPEKSLKIGDSFDQETPLTIPMQGAAPVQMLLTTRYTLKRIEGSHAHFDIVQTYALSSDSEQNMITLTGSGKGTMTYDSKVYQITAMVTKSTMGMLVKSGEMESTITTMTDTDVKTSVSPIR